MATKQDSTTKTIDLLTHLASRPGHDEVKADFRELLVEEFGAERSNLEFERRVPEVKGRLDALIGRTILEAKSNLDKEWGDVVRRMPDYLRDRETEEKEKFVGIATDGLKWAVFERANSELVKVKETILDPTKPDVFLAWLDGAIALKSSLPPEPLTIRQELGQDSIAYHRASQELRSLWDRLKNDKAVHLKRQLWATLLKLVYGKEIENDDLWFQHTYLVVVAKAIALAVLGISDDEPKRVLSGASFQAISILGAVESDFFDWVVADAEGEKLVSRIINHVRRFRLGEVQSDVLKILYESLIDRDERHGLGEYYTPDWLAAKVVRHSVTSPVEQKVLDPACGSGTFLFHAIRNFITEANEAGMKPHLVASEVTSHVAGMDIHPVAVIIARVTYLLAIAPTLNKREGAISIPVYLGDAMQLSIGEWMGGKELTIKVPPSAAGESKSGELTNDGREQLDFPDTFCRDPALFDKAIERMRTGSLEDLTRAQIEAALKRIVEQHYKRDINQEEEFAIKDMGKTYVVFDKLRREGRDSVWAYVARNLSRPLAYSAAGGWANVVVGNPPWVAFRHMSADLQKRFKELAKGERVFVGRVSSQNDLCALFTVRAAGLYLRAAGRIAFVLPLAALTRGQFEKFRKGSFDSTRLAFDQSWTMDETVQPLFPVPACVIFARKRATATSIPETVRSFSGSLPYRDAPEEIADGHLTVTENAPRPTEAVHVGGSPYRSSFRNGATLFPRMLIFVERATAGMLGANPEMPMVKSRRTTQEKQPWKSLTAVEGSVEAEFVRPILLGESIVPYRIFQPFEGVVAINGKGHLLDAKAAADRGYSGLHSWLSKVESLWTENRSSEKITFKELNDYFGQLTSQFPLKKLRVVYSKAGMSPAACLVRSDDFIIENKLYWFAPNSINEALFLVAILNSETGRARAEKYQSRGQWGARDFDKVIFTLPIPIFDPKSKLHLSLCQAALESEKLAAQIELPDGVKFQRARKLVRDALKAAGISKKIDELVVRLLDGTISD
jgi:SAM-dependent methyltransferase